VRDIVMLEIMEVWTILM